MRIDSINPGELITYRDRDWMVLPSDDKELLQIRPLGGSEEEETAVYLPLLEDGEIKPATFERPRPSQLGNLESARLLYNAARLSFRNAAGPFRCMAKLSFQPRSYQLVPLVMALKQDVTRLMVADDVGIGKTIEALIILKELIERGDIKKFAVICPPHLCEQWEAELKDKLDINAEIIRSSTAAKLDRSIPDDRSIFHHVPYQVISIDYIKADKRKDLFKQDCPPLVIVDEAHTCALPEGSKSKKQQLRHSLLYDLAEDPGRHILLLTATPHSGKDSEFLSLLGLLKPEFRQFNLEKNEEKNRRKLAQYFIQRKRANIKCWLNEDTHFPERESKEIGYSLSPEYQLFYQNILRFARGISSAEGENKQTQLLRSWAAIALIRGVMSSPSMAMGMLQRRREKLINEEVITSVPEIQQSLFESTDHADDTTRTDLIEGIKFSREQLSELDQLRTEAATLADPAMDLKLATCVKMVKKWLKEGFQPIVFCKYIATAHYLAEHLKKALPKSVHVEAVTSELADEQRKERIEVMGKSEKRVLVATDCLSEGINLQEQFTAVIHYDLPWNPNRIEQREGRVDRFGQDAKIVRTYVLYGEDNEMDEFVLDVLIRKVRDIQKSTGVSITIGDQSKSIMTEAAQRILFGSEGKQQTLFAKETVSNELELARKKGENLRSIFAHESVDPETIKADLEKVDEAIGDVKSVQDFVLGSVTRLGALVRSDENGYLIQPRNLPAHLRTHFKDADQVKISFDSPTPKGYMYIGRNHGFTEQLCNFMLALAFDGHEEHGTLGRVAQIQTSAVEIETTLIMFRVRNVIKEVRSKREVVAEEMYLWGYRSDGATTETLDFQTCKELMLESVPLGDLSTQRQEARIQHALSEFDSKEPLFMDLAIERADELVHAHLRFKELVKGRSYEKATPVLPPDVMGLYVLSPKPKAL